MIPVNDLIAIFDRMYREHWSYEWGAAREGCVDCSGAFVYAFKQFGVSIAHGSNNIARNYVRGLEPVSAAAPGMAAFKIRKPGQSGYDLPARYADSSDQNDYYHIGLVDSTGQYVLNAKSTSAGFSRDPISKWACVGRLKAVEYGGKPMEHTEMMVVTCTPGETVRLRRGPSTREDAIAKIPNGETVTAGPDNDGWRAVTYQGKTGYMISKYLVPYSAESTGGTVSITLPRDLAEKLRDALLDVLGAG